MEEAWPVNVRYTRRALAQIDDALTYIEARSPQGAAHVRAGRATSRPNVRRLPTNPYPYLIDYRVGENEIVVLRFRHSARRPLNP